MSRNIECSGKEFLYDGEEQFNFSKINTKYKQMI